MLQKLKNILGIEGVKIGLLIDDPIYRDEGAIFGKILLSSMTEQRVEFVELKFIEKYERGRKDSKLIDEYELGSVIVNEPILVPKDKEIQVPFTLPYHHLESEMDKIGDANIFNRGIVKFAKMLKGVKSQYKLVAKAKVKGTTLDPIVTKVIILE